MHGQYTFPHSLPCNNPLYTTLPLLISAPYSRYVSRSFVSSPALSNFPHTIFSTSRIRRLFLIIQMFIPNGLSLTFSLSLNFSSVATDLLTSAPCTAIARSAWSSGFEWPRLASLMTYSLKPSSFDVPELLWVSASPSIPISSLQGYLRYFYCGSPSRAALDLIQARHPVPAKPANLHTLQALHPSHPTQRTANPPHRPPPPRHLCYGSLLGSTWPRLLHSPMVFPHLSIACCSSLPAASTQSATAFTW